MTEQVTSIQKMLDAVDARVLGVFWITKEPLSPTLPLAKEVDYLSNSQLAQYYIRSHGVATMQQSNIFIQKSFGEDFFICHLHQPINAEESAVKQIKALIQGIKSQRKKMIVIDNTERNYQQLISKEFPELEVENYLP